MQRWLDSCSAGASTRARAGAGWAGAAIGAAGLAGVIAAVWGRADMARLRVARGTRGVAGRIAMRRIGEGLEARRSLCALPTTAFLEIPRSLPISAVESPSFQSLVSSEIRSSVQSMPTSALSIVAGWSPTTRYRDIIRGAAVKRSARP